MEYELSDVVRASEFSRQAHAGQFDKAGVEYFKHPNAVANRLDTNFEKIVALLHDVVEDTDCTLEYIGLKFGQEVARVVGILTHKKGEPFQDYIARVAKDRTATRVKLADLNHNMDMLRFPNPQDKDYQRVVKKYIPAYAYLSEVLVTRYGDKS